MKNKLKTSENYLSKTVLRYMTSSIGAYFFGCVGVVITGIMTGLLVDQNGLAAVSLCLPVYYFFAALTMLIHCGTSTYVASLSDENDEEGANRYYTLSIVAASTLSVLFLVLGLLFTDEIAYLLGARDELTKVTTDYLRILMYGAPASMFLYMPINYIRLTTKPGLAPVCHFIQALSCIILTYIFIVFFDMGASGAALASIVSNYILVIIGLLIIRSNSTLRLTKISKCIGEIKNVLKVGLPSSLDSIGCIVRVIFLNMIAYEIGGTIGVCVIGIVSSVLEFCSTFLIGNPQAIVPLIAIFNSEKDTLSVRKTFSASLQFGLVIIGIFVLLLEVFASQVAAIFGITESAMNIMTANAIRVFAVGLLFAIVSCMLSTIYATIGRAIIANIIVLLRNAVLIIPIAFIISGFTDNIILLVLSFPITELLTMAAGLISSSIISRKKKECSGILLLDDKVEKEGKIAAFTVTNMPEKIVECSQSVNEFCETNELTAKQTMAMSLSIEELLMVVGDKCLNKDPNETIEIRLFKYEDTLGLRIRNGGNKLNILEYALNDPDNMDNMGIIMIKKIAQSIEYRNTFGINNLLIIM